MILRFFLSLYDLSMICQAMVARGDLGAELPIEEVPLLQVNPGHGLRKEFVGIYAFAIMIMPCYVLGRDNQKV